ncbi:hypothetical protein AM493_00345 [Flavobacterium akiainvivens]|uniref:Secretion system C-terminal sorting domain-containing protein n=1 Tax=Flavobacterium akiainvivens TaxID=1202724 RepID=A0A0M9VGM9_9FLAO|nr:GEVED domain-containing protein [Flavobacterium akiainvivens]KOS04660.1 hypothetical protein AM493_00345 [Flavobacterium akiainvivens]SFQ65311.1 Por secretion system C-terminal sorting domain-containing protein [Flavobacterium akiainvivens]
MKRNLLFQLGLILLFALSANSLSAQIAYSQNFNDEDNIDWEDEQGYFWLEDEDACDGYSLATELYAGNVDGIATSDVIGVSNGQPAQLSYSYKLLDYYEGTAYPNTLAWGSFTVSYATAATGPWTALETISPSNHVVSADCAVRTISFTPPSGNVYLRLTVDVNQDDEDYEVDALLYFDNLTVIQGNCSGAPAVATALSSMAEACTNNSFTLSLAPEFLQFGITYQWQVSTDGTTFTNVAAGGTGATYTTTQSQTSWYRAVVTCTNSGQSTNSTAVEVESTGGVCYCDVEFDAGVEPITYVDFAGISNTTSEEVDETPSMEDFTNLGPAEVVKGETYTITLRGNTAGEFDNYFTVYIDFNQNGNLDDEGEVFQIGSLYESDGSPESEVLTEDIEIPATALTGLTRMRIFKSFDAFTTTPCSSDDASGYGQIEDYTINIFEPCNTPAPEAEALQVVCPGATIGDLSAEGTVIKWYAATTGGEALAAATVLTATTYYAAQIPEGSCESEERTAVAVEFSVIPSPVAEEATQVFCEEAYVGDLEVVADGEVVWYASETGEDVVSDEAELVSGTTYYAAQFVEGCESATRTGVTATVNIVTAPVAETQSFSVEEGETISLEDIEVAADAPLTWYESEEDALNNTDALNPETYAVNVGETVTLYVVQTVGECVSAPTAVTITVTLGSERFTMAGLTYYPNPVKDVFTLGYKNTIDTVEVYNLVGQCVLRQQAAGTDATLNLGSLASGSYMVKVQSGTETGIIKIIKH